MLSHDQIPPGGWQFFQPQTGWSMPSPVGKTFNTAVQEIVKHRRANLAIAMRYQLSMDTDKVGMELDNYTRARLGIPPEPIPKSEPRLALPKSVGEGVAAVVKTAQGAALLIDWLASGAQSVSPQEALARARVCSTCPLNKPDSLTSWFSQPVSEMIRKQLEARKDLSLQTELDDKLGICSVCLCPMKLKVWTPLDYILAHTKNETYSQFPKFCWIVKS